MVKVNGEQVNADEKTVAELLAGAGYDITRVAVELNGEIVPKGSYGSVVLKDGDCLEAVSFVGGG